MVISLWILGVGISLAHAGECFQHLPPNELRAGEDWRVRISCPLDDAALPSRVAVCYRTAEGAPWHRAVFKHSATPQELVALVPAVAIEPPTLEYVIGQGVFLGDEGADPERPCDLETSKAEGAWVGAWDDPVVLPVRGDTRRSREARLIARDGGRHHTVLAEVASLHVAGEFWRTADPDIVHQARLEFRTQSRRAFGPERSRWVLRSYGGGVRAMAGRDGRSCLLPDLLSCGDLVMGPVARAQIERADRLGVEGSWMFGADEQGRHTGGGLDLRFGPDPGLSLRLGGELSLGRDFVFYDSSFRMHLDSLPRVPMEVGFGISNMPGAVRERDESLLTTMWHDAVIDLRLRGAPVISAKGVSLPFSIGWLTRTSDPTNSALGASLGIEWTF